MRRFENLRSRVPAEFRSRIKIARARAACDLGEHRFCTPALGQMDRKLAAMFPKRPGTFLEIGANDGYSQSNSYYLERHLGWRGILVEPLPSYGSICRSHRSGSSVYQTACGAPDSSPFAALVDAGLTSSLVGRVDPKSLRVPVTTLSQVIDDAGMGVPDIISLDVEGFELPVLEGLQLERHCPRVMLVETSQIDNVARAVEPWLSLHEQWTHHDFVFVAQDSREDGGRP